MSCHLLFDHFQFALIHGPDISGSYEILLFTALNPASITSHIHNWVLFLLWFCLFILSGVISPRISRGILDTFRPGECIFQCPIFFPFHTIHRVLKPRILKWFAIPFSSGPRKDHEELWKTLEEMRIPDHLTCLLRNLHAGQEAIGRTRHGTTDWFQIGKRVHQGYILSPAYSTYMQTKSCEMPDWMKLKLKSRLPGEISITSDIQMTPPLWQKAKRN